MASPPDPALLLRALKFTRIPGNTIAQACARYGITQGAYQRARRATGPLPYTDDERILTAVAWFGGRLDMPGILSFLDWIEHCVYRDDEVRPIVDRLVEAGTLQVEGDAWVLAVEWP